jgi:hypothetical protein
MKTKSALARRIGLLVFLSVVSMASADNAWLEAQSTYLGNGSFQYRIGTRPCPFINTLTVTFAGIESTNWVQVGTVPAGWSFTNQSWAATWTADDQAESWETEPYDAVFEMNSSMTNYKQGTGMVLMSLTLFGMQGLTSVVSENIVGYWMFPALIPCLPGQADGSPASLYADLGYSDIAITQLIRDGQGTTGIEFNYDFGDATFLLEATSDMKNWQNVTYLYGQSGTNTWTTNTDLGQWGNFFRLEYVGSGQIPASSLPALNPTVTPDAAVKTDAVQGKSIQPIVTTVNGSLTVQLNTTPGLNYEVDVSNAGKLVWSARSVATQNQLIIPLPVGDLPASGVIQAQELP